MTGTTGNLAEANVSEVIAENEAILNVPKETTFKISSELAPTSKD